MPESSLFDACLLHEGNFFDTTHIISCAHADGAKTYRIHHSAHISNTACSGFPHYWSRATQLSRRHLCRNRGLAADRGTPRLRLQTDRCSGRTRGRCALHAASCNRGPISYCPSFRWLHLRLFFLLLLISPHHPLNANVSFHSSEPPEVMPML